MAEVSECDEVPEKTCPMCGRATLTRECDQYDFWWECKACDELYTDDEV